MLRSILENLIGNENNSKLISKLATVLIAVGVLWMAILFPLCGKFYSINSKSLHTPLNYDELNKLINSTVIQQIHDYYSKSDHSLQSIYQYTHDILRIETYYHKFDLANSIFEYSNSTNLISVVRAKQGYGRECIVIAYNYNFEKYEVIPFAGKKSTNKNTTQHIGNVIMALLMQYTFSQMSNLMIRLAFKGHYICRI
jgi:hypothetical protein